MTKRTGMDLDPDEHDRRIDVARAVFDELGAVRLGEFCRRACLSTNAARAWIDKCVSTGEIIRVDAEPYPRHIMPPDDSEVRGSGGFSHVIRRAESAPRIETTGAVSVWGYADAMRCD